MIKEISSFYKILEDFVKSVIERKMQRIDIFVVKEINEENFTVNIKHPNFKNLEFNDVPISSVGLGNFKGGIMKIPSVNDYVLVVFLGENYEEPIVLNTVFNNNDNGKQAIPQIKDNELFLSNRGKGSYIIINQDNDITLRACDSNGVKKASIKIDSNGTITLNEGSLSIARVTDLVEVKGETETAASHKHNIDLIATIKTGGDSIKG